MPKRHFSIGSTRKVAEGFRIQPLLGCISIILKVQQGVHGPSLDPAASTIKGPKPALTLRWEADKLRGALPVSKVLGIIAPLGHGALIKKWDPATSGEEKADEYG